MKLYTVQRSKIVRLAVLAVLLMLLGAFWGCSDDKLVSGEPDKSDVGVGVCEPGVGKTADDDCNFCTCSDDGQWECTAKMCLEDAGTDDAGEDATAPTDVSEVCVEGETKSVECNSCVCDDAGNWSCTEEDCSVDDSCSGLTCGARCSTCDSADGDCPPVVEYCNGAGACTLEIPECSDDGENCTAGSAKKIDCNTCECDDAGKWSCTKRGCVATDPCEGVACGERCTTCVPTDDAECSAVMEYCNAAGKCTTESPVCGN